MVAAAEDPAMKKQKVTGAGGDSMEVDAVGTPGKTFKEGNTHDLMPLYYGRLFPHQEMYKWLSYGQGSKHPKADQGFFKKREFCFTLDGDIFVRYQSFRDADEMKAAIKDRCPAKIDIGPVFNVDPQKRTAYTSGSQAFAPVERELVFDIDMTDYDDIRTCCSGANICSKCWHFMTVAIKCIDDILEEEFGFEHRLWVFSGRRGVHCWVADKRARMLTDEQRSSLANFFTVIKGTEGGKAKLALTSPLHPTLQRVYENILEPMFQSHILPGQRLLEDEEAREKLLAMIPDGDVCDSIRGDSRWKKVTAGDDDVNRTRWELIKREVEKVTKQKQNKNYALKRCIEEIVFAYTYPRLDAEVSKHMNHLLKAPFCVHPKTGRVCVPIDAAAAEEFDPFVVPTVAQLLNELDEAGPGAAPAGGEDWRRTSMAQAVELFHTSFLNALAKEGKEELAEKSRAHAAVAATTLAF